MFFFFNDTATTEIYTLSLHDALPICGVGVEGELGVVVGVHVDDARHDDETVGVDRLARAGEPADVGDQTERDADVGDAAGQARAVHHPAALDDRVEHGAPSSVHPMYLRSPYAA